MAQFSGKYFKVWKVKEQNGYTKLDLGDSKKNKEGTYDNFSWFDCLLVGNAKGVQVSEGDTVEVKSGIISQEKYNDKWYTRIVIFELDVTASTAGQEQVNNGSNNGGGTGGSFEDNIPFAADYGV